MFREKVPVSPAMIALRVAGLAALIIGVVLSFPGGFALEAAAARYPRREERIASRYVFGVSRVGQAELGNEAPETRGTAPAGNF